MRPLTLMLALSVVCAVAIGLNSEPCCSQTVQVAAAINVSGSPAGKVDAQVTEVDALVKKVWDDYGLRPSRDATDSEWCR